MKIQRYGYIPDLPDQRDRVYRPSLLTYLRDHTDLRDMLPSCYDQSQLGSCTGNSTAGAIQYCFKKQRLEDVTPSRLMLYYGGRLLEGTVTVDSGCQLRDVLKAANRYGACPETEWPYDIEKFAVKPTHECFVVGYRDRALRYESIAQDITQMRLCLNEGFPFLLGFTCYESFESDEVARTGVLNMPHPDEQVAGGHAVLVVGDDLPSRRFLVRNSYGPAWGQHGYFTIPYEYVSNPNLASDFWKLSLVE